MRLSPTVCPTLRARTYPVARLLFGAALAGVLWLCLGAGPVAAEDQGATLDPVWRPLVERLSGDGLERGEVAALFAAPGVVYDPGAMGRRMRALFENEFAGGGSPEEDQGPTLRDLRLTAELLAKVVFFQWRHAEALAAAGEEYGVAPEVVLAVLVKETKLGGYLGERPALVSLASMAVAGDYEAVAGFLDDLAPSREQRAWIDAQRAERAQWAYGELMALIAYARANDLDAATMPGSVYGAIGLCQFLPTNALALGRDGDGDGRVNLFEPADAIPSVANYLHVSGWRQDLDEEGRIEVLRRYNNDEAYARSVLAIAERLRGLARGGE